MAKWALVGTVEVWDILEMWRVRRKMAECTKRAGTLDGEMSEFVNFDHGVAQG